MTKAATIEDLKKAIQIRFSENYEPLALAASLLEDKKQDPAWQILLNNNDHQLVQLAKDNGLDVYSMTTFQPQDFKIPETIRFIDSFPIKNDVELKKAEALLQSNKNTIQVKGLNWEYLLFSSISLRMAIQTYNLKGCRK